MRRMRRRCDVPATARFDGRLRYMTPKVRQRIPWLSLGALAIIMTITLGNAVINVLTTYHFPTTRELQREEQASLVAVRRERIVAIVAEGDRCRAPIAREL